MNFYTKILSKFVLGHEVRLNVEVTVEQDAGISQQKIEEAEAALQELGLNSKIQVK